MIGLQTIKVNNGSEFVVNYNGKYVCGPYSIQDRHNILEAVNAAIGLIAARN